jgi:ribonuclease E
MESSRNQREVENRLREALHFDRARVQMGKISRFGLLELSRQRLRPALAETSYIPCPRCTGTGHIRSTESAALHILRILEEEAMKENTGAVHTQIPVDVATFLLNEKRSDVQAIELRHKVNIALIPNIHLETPAYQLARLRHDQLNQEEALPPSYKMVEVPQEEEYKPTTPTEGRVQRQEAVVKGIRPEQPAPLASVWAEAAPQAAEPRKAGIIQRFLAWLRGEPKPAAPVAPVEEPRERPVGRDLGRRGGRAQREGPPRGGRPERGERPERSEARSMGRLEGVEAGREGRRARPERPERAERPDRTERGERPERTDKQERGERPERPERGEARPSEQRPPRPPRAAPPSSAEEPSAGRAEGAIPVEGGEAAPEGAQRGRRGRRGGRGGRSERKPDIAATPVELRAEAGSPPAMPEATPQPEVTQPLQPSAPAEMIGAPAPVPLPEPSVEIRMTELDASESRTILPPMPIAVPEIRRAIEVVEEAVTTSAEPQALAAPEPALAQPEPALEASGLVLVETDPSRTQVWKDSEPVSEPPPPPRRRPSIATVPQEAEPLVQIETRK